MLKIKLVVLSFISAVFSSFAQSVLVNSEGMAEKPAAKFYADTVFISVAHADIDGMVNHDGKIPASIFFADGFCFEGARLRCWGVNAPVLVAVSGFDAAKNVTAYSDFNKRRSSMPVPSSFFLMGVGILALAAVRYKSAA